MRLLPNYHRCFVCGSTNPTGIKAHFYRNEDHVLATCDFTEHHAGYKGIVHGGLISAVLDEALGRIVASITRKMVFTGALTLHFHKPLLVGTAVKAEARVAEKQRHPKFYTQATGKLIDIKTNEVYASAEGNFFPIPVEKYDEMFAALEIEGCPKAVTLEDI